MPNMSVLAIKTCLTSLTVKDVKLFYDNNLSNLLLIGPCLWNFH